MKEPSNIERMLGMDADDGREALTLADARVEENAPGEPNGRR